jgi:hypothetical protein
MKNLFFLIPLLALGCLTMGCNPDCTNIPGLRVSSSFNPVGFEVLITSNVPADLNNKSVFFGETKVEPKFVPDVGLRVTVPEGASGDTEIRIEDGDCVDYAAVGFSVVDENFFLNNPNFIPPIPPQIIIPSPPPSFPPSIDNAWLSPENTDYCLWFIMEKDILPDGSLIESNTIDRDSSFEQSTCNQVDENLLYRRNPIFGIVDKDANLINIWIDRRAIGESLEEFHGEFIDLQDTPYADENFSAPCVGSIGKKGFIMLLTSQCTGRQVLAFQPG